MFLASVHMPDDYVPSAEDEAIGREIHALNGELEAAGAMVFACGLQPVNLAKIVQAQPEGKYLITDGPYLETKEHIGGFLIFKAESMDEALAWARKGATACRRPVEVREIFFDEG